MKTIAAFVLLVCLIAVGVKGQDRAGASKGRCLCLHKGVNMVLVKNIEKFEIIPPSPSCNKLEIIVTLKNGAGQKCLNPASKLVQEILRNLEKKSQQSVPHSTTDTVKKTLTPTTSAPTSFK